MVETSSPDLILPVQGVINAAPLAYIFPALCVLKLQNERIVSWKNLPVIMTALFGILVSGVGLVMTVLEIADGLSCSHGAEMPYCLSPYSVNITGWSAPATQSFLRATMMHGAEMVAP